MAPLHLNRRTFVAGTSAGIAATLAGSACSVARDSRPVAAGSPAAGPTGPFDTMREMIEALDARGRLLRIGHLGDLNEPMILGALATLETGMRQLGIPHRPGGVGAAIAELARDEGGAVACATR